MTQHKQTTLSYNHTAKKRYYPSFFYAWQKIYSFTFLEAGFDSLCKRSSAVTT